MYLKVLNIRIPLAFLMVLISLAPKLTCAETNVSIAVQLNESTIQYDRRTGTSTLNVSIRNIGPETLLYPIKVIIESTSSPEVILANADGQTIEGKPYFLYTSPQGTSNTFENSQQSSNKRWLFKNPNRVRFNYQTTVLASKYAETLNTPSEISQTPHPIIGRDISTREYVGQIDLPPGLQIEPSSLFVKTHLAGQTAISHEGLFQSVMNSNATTLMTVVKPDGNEILMKLFPKGEYLAEINPVINTKSTAIALVALDPGFLTTVPQLDAMLLGALNTLPETGMLADQIAYEIEQGAFSVNGPHSESVQEKIIAIHLKFEILRVEDVLDLPVSAKIGIHLKNFLNSVVSTAYAAIYAEQCSDGFSESFKGDLGNRDEICIAASIKSDEDSNFAIWNRKSRWAVFKDMEIAPPSVVFDWIPPRHISMPSTYDFFKGFFEIGGTAVAEVSSSNYWKSIFDPSLREGKTHQALDDFTNKSFGVRKSVARYRFPKQGENKLSTISFSKNPAQLNNSYVDFWGAPTLVLTMVTEVVAPVVSIGMELDKKELDDAISRDTIAGCVTNNKFKDWIASTGVDLVQLLSESDIKVPLEDKVDFFVNNLISEEKAYELLYCVAGIDFNVLLETKLGDKTLKTLTDLGLKTLDKAFVKAKLAAGVGNIFVTVRDGYNEDIAAIDHYKAIVGINTPPIPTGKLNDTGITTCSNDTSNNLPCPVAGFPRHDAQFGRDAKMMAGTLQKVGGGEAGFDFTKLDSNGNQLPASASAWDCVKDNVTGLIWEVKTTNGLRSMNNTYSWFEPDNSKNGGSVGAQNGGSSCTGSSCDTYGYVQAVNSQGLCGASDWRMPDVNELLSIVNNATTSPAIDTGYFPNTPDTDFWSSSPSAKSTDSAWFVHFIHGYVLNNSKNGSSHIRLVRGGQ